MPVKILRFAAGAAIGFVLWWYGTPLYAAIIAPVTRLFLRPFASTQLASAGMDLNVSGAGIPGAHVPFGELTYNIIVFLGLFATARGLFRDRNVARFAIACAVLVLTHAMATAADIMATYATQLGTWSQAHFSPNAQDFWTALDYIYRMGGMFGIAFAAWYLAVEPSRH